MSDLIITELKGSETASRLAQSFYEIHNNSAVGKYTTQCLKMIKKVSYDITREASYLYICWPKVHEQWQKRSDLEGF